MINKYLLLYSALFLNLCHEGYAADIKTSDDKLSANHYTFRGIYSYQDFTFHAIKADNFNRYQGHTNLYGLGVHDSLLAHDVIAGLSIHQFDTQIDSQTRVNQPNTTYSRQSIHNNSLSGHVLKKIREHFFLDLSGGLGQNRLRYTNKTDYQTNSEQLGTGHSQSNGWFTSLNAIYSKSWRTFHLMGSVGFLYNDVTQNSYSLLFTPTDTKSQIPKVRNQSSFALENAEIRYELNNTIQPFVNAGLLQVLQFSNSRPIINDIGLGSLPEFNVDNNGYHAGGGFVAQYKSWHLRLEQQYNQRGNRFHSNLSLASLTLDID